MPCVIRRPYPSRHGTRSESTAGTAVPSWSSTTSASSFCSTSAMKPGMKSVVIAWRSSDFSRPGSCMKRNAPSSVESCSCFGTGGFLSAPKRPRAAASARSVVSRTQSRASGSASKCGAAGSRSPSGSDSSCVASNCFRSDGTARWSLMSRLRVLRFLGQRTPGYLGRRRRRRSQRPVGSSPFTFGSIGRARGLRHTAASTVVRRMEDVPDSDSETSRRMSTRSPSEL
mmetsp:Transcript_19763/g.61380  ORF Transcript_19763/g.61380 Transcript_19763/m.61380 type:complete len:228 (-) Transcript_19763:562-1245(-)